MPLAKNKLRLLLVEDDEYDLFFLQQVLVQGGYTHPFQRMRDGAEAIKYLEQLEENPALTPPHLILMDLKMPRMNAVDVLQWMRARPRYEKFPVVILTSSDEPSDIRKTGGLNIYKFITKQVRYENVLSTLEAFLSQHPA